MEKFSLKWNDFQTTVTNSFKLLKQEKEFFDVTLVSDDQKQIKSHKVVLSACSGFFKSILENNAHSFPMIYLSGIDSTNLKLIMDYIYDGEVQVYQEQLDSFLTVAQKLMIAGLLKDKSENDLEIQLKDEFAVSEPQTKHNNSQLEELDTSNMKIAIPNHDQNEINKTIQENLIKENGNYKCHVCGKKSKLLGDIKRHIETHIDGLCYECSSCSKIFKTSDSLRSHKRKWCQTNKEFH